MKKTLAAMVAAVLMVGLVSSMAVAAPKATSLWSVYNINAGGTSYTPKAAPGDTSSVANFAFPSSPTAALLTTGKDKALLGDLTGKTITATFTVTSSGTFTYGGGFCGSSDTYVRLFFETSGKFAYANYWWSNNSPTTNSYTFVDNSTATVTISESLTSTNWSDWNGEPAATVPDAFAAAIKHVSQIGLSFGGGCFFANGVGVSSGTASFTLTNYTVS